MVDPQEGDINGILPGQTLQMNVLISNTNPVPVQVTGLTATFNDGGVCALTVAPVNGWYPYPLAASTSYWDALNVTMGDAAPGCEGWAGLLVTATATGTMP